MDCRRLEFVIILLYKYISLLCQRGLAVSVNAACSLHHGFLFDINVNSLKGLFSESSWAYSAQQNGLGRSRQGGGHKQDTCSRRVTQETRKGTGDLHVARSTSQVRLWVRQKATHFPYWSSCILSYLFGTTKQTYFLRLEVFSVFFLIFYFKGGGRTSVRRVWLHRGKGCGGMCTLYGLHSSASNPSSHLRM